MPSNTENKSNSLLSTQTEKPLHYTYLKEFRCDQCPLFLQHKCTQHKPFTCFHWHFMNQRRRRPLRRRDGSFNYSPDIYCTKYDETTGICQEGDDCQYLHRTAGDTERRYHLRYYKTGICVYDTDSRGYCVKNGPHCAFAHGIHDLRNPVYDIRELQAMELGGISGLIVSENASGTAVSNSGLNALIGPNSLDKERNALNDDPRWQDTTYVLANYKTEVCKRPPRLCRQGYACPQFHNNKDRRRPPKKFKYRSTPCPNVKQGDEWGDPTNCEAGDSCPYCHTRTEQQFHPEIYKSTKCNDMQQTNYCPRGPFCAFAHVDKEISAARDLNIDNSTDLATLLSSALPTSTVSNNINSNENNVVTTVATSAGKQNTISSSSLSISQSCTTNTTSLTISRPNQSNQQNKQTTSTSVASSLPDHFGTNFESTHFVGTSSLQQQLFNREQTPPTAIGSSPNTSIGSVITNINVSCSIACSSSASNPATSSMPIQVPGPGPIARPRSYSSSNTTTNLPNPVSNLSVHGESLLSSYFKNVEEKQNLLMNGPASVSRKISTPSTSFFGTSNSSFFGALTNREGGNGVSLFGAPGYPTTADTVESVVGSALEDLSLDDIHLEASLEKELGPSSHARNSVLGESVEISSNGSNCVLGRSPVQATLLGSTAPVNIPGARLESHRSNIANLSSPPMNASPLASLGTHSGGPFGVSPYNRSSINACHVVSSSATSSLYDFSTGANMSPSSINAQSAGNSSIVQATASMLEIQRLREELAHSKAKIFSWEESIVQARTACEAWKREAEEATRREKMIEQQRDEALIRINTLQKEVEQMTGGPYLRALTRLSELENLPINQLQQLQQQLRSDLDCIDKVSARRMDLH